MRDEKMTRSRAAGMIDSIRKMLANRSTAEQIEEMMEREYQVKPLVECTGEAHSNPHIDNCGLCSPRWGLTGSYIKIT